MGQTLFCILVAFTSFATCQAKIDIGEKFVEAINTPSIFKEQNLGPIIFESTDFAKAEKAIKSFHEIYSPLEYHHSDINEFNMPNGKSYVMHIYARKKGEKMYSDFQMRLSPNSKKIKEIAFVAEVSEPISLPNGAIEDTNTLSWLHNYVKNLNEQYDLYGSILLAKGDDIFFEKYFGYEDVLKTKPINSSTRFNIASGGKMFTSIAIMQLVEEGKIKLNDPITKYLSGFTDKKKAEKITIHHLLSHTSGIIDYWQGQKIPELENAASNNIHLNIVLKMGFAFDAGQDYQYCNSNYILAGAIVEKVSKTDFYKYVKENILDKAEMKNTGYDHFSTNGIAKFLSKSEDKKSWKEHKGGLMGSAAGGAISQGKDFVLFTKALQTDKLISNKCLALITSVQNQPHHQPEGYGYGFSPQHHGDVSSYGHGGTAEGVNFEYRYFPELDITMVVFSNQDNGAFDDLKRNTFKLITGTR